MSDLFVGDILQQWGAGVADIPICDARTLETKLQYLSFAQAGRWCAIDGAFGEECRVLVPVDSSEAAGRVVIRRLSGARQTAVTIVILKPIGSVAIGIGGVAARIFLGHFGYDFKAQINTWRDPTVCIGDRATCNGATIVADDADIVIGRDCMLSDQVVLQSHDQHGIVDLGAMRIANAGRHHLRLGEHVWLGRRAMVMPNVTIGAGSIVSAGAIVTHDVPPLAVAAGVPARVVRSNVTWSRDPVRIDAQAQRFIEGLDDHA
jgi:acetyltransferase-like isoleucine patch superfamily enzyme